MYAGLLGGLVGGFLSNPAEIVFTRMQVDEMYPPQCRRNYRNFTEGIIKVAEEGALFRGGLANGLKLGLMLTCATGANDWMKENTYYFFGPQLLTRLAGTAGGVVAAMTLSMPFDMIKTRLHTMRSLPNGNMPYNNTFDCMGKIIKFECSFEKQANFRSFYAGGQPYFFRLFGIALISQYLLDFYHATDNKSEFWQPARHHYTTGIDYDIHNPYTDAFNNMMTSVWMSKAGNNGMHPESKDTIRVV